MSKLLFRGRVCHSLAPSTLEILQDVLLGVSDGIIVFVYEFEDVDNHDLSRFLEQEGFSDACIIHLTDTQFLVPGFIDTHIHAPQYPNAGFGMDLPLLEWLEKYTFPTESSMSDAVRARDVFGQLVRQTVRQGTTFACYYSSIHTEATNILADLCLESGQRAFIGKCSMDHMTPEHYSETCQESLDACRECHRYVKQIDPAGEYLTFCVTPRFAPSCTRQLMTELGTFAKVEGLPIQTHIAENKAELALVKSMFPEHNTYTDVYDSHGLLTHRTILAHAVYLSDYEMDLIKSRGTGIAHCPASNTALSSGEAPIRELLDRDIAVGLGTDVSGGYTASILDSARLACGVSRHRVMHTGRKELALNAADVLYMATLGGARVCRVESKLGNFVVGKYFDALLIDLSRDQNGRVDIFGGESDQKIVEKWLFNGDDRNIRTVYVNGRVISGAV